MTKKKSLLLLTVAVCFIALVALVSVPKTVSAAYAHDIPASEFDPSEFSELTYGIYWYRAGSDVPVAAKDATNYDPTKPTVIYAHGMKAMHEGLEKREGMSLKDNNKESMNRYGYADYRYDGEFYDSLIAQGYNVGVFYWNQLADLLMTEERRFWTTKALDEDSGAYTEDMRFCYVDENGDYVRTEKNDPRNPKVTYTALYRDSIISALGKDFSGHLQLIGHSMGGQLTLAVSQALCVAYDKGEIGSNLLPDRVTLLDPYLGSRKCTGTVDTTGEEVWEKPSASLAAEAAENVAKHGIPIEAYGVNEMMVYRYYEMIGMGIGDKNEIARVTQLFTDNIAWVYLEALMDRYRTFIPTHTMAVDYYFSTMYMTPAYDNAGVEVPSFHASDEHILRLRGMAFSQRYDETLTKPNPIYQNESVYVRVDGVTSLPIRRPEELPQALSGTVSETERSLTVKLLNEEGEVVSEAPTIKGRYFFANVEEGDYTLAFYYGDKKIADGEAEITYYDDVAKVEQVNTVIPQETTERVSIDKNLVWIIVGACGVVILLACLFFRKSRG